MRLFISIAAVAATFAVSARVSEGANVRAHWPLEDAATQDVVGGRHGTKSSGATIVPQGQGKALEIGANDSVRIQAVPSPDPNLQPRHISVEAWVKRQSPGAPDLFAYVVSKGAHGCSFASYALYTDHTGGLFFYIAPESGGYIHSPGALPTEIWDGKWHHVIGAFDGNAVRLCVDGQEVGTATPAPNAVIRYDLSKRDFLIGQYDETNCAGVTRWSDSNPVLIDEVKIWDDAIPCKPVDKRECDCCDKCECSVKRWWKRLFD